MKISIVTISFNQAEFLREAVESVVSQRHEHRAIEYVVVDAGSSDGSAQILEGYGSRVDRLILEPDRGPPDGLNKGFAVSTGDILGFINADDRLEPGALEFVLDYFDSRPEVDVVTGALRVIDRDGVTASIQVAPPFTLDRYLNRCMTVLQPSTFFRRRAWDLAGGFNEENQVSWDAELFVDMLLGGAKFGRTTRTLASFRTYDAQWSSRFSELLGDEQERIRARIVEAGYEPASGVARMFRIIGWKTRPLVRIRQGLMKYQTRGVG